MGICEKYKELLKSVHRLEEEIIDLEVQKEVEIRNINQTYRKKIEEKTKEKQKNGEEAQKYISTINNSSSFHVNSIVPVLADLMTIYTGDKYTCLSELGTFIICKNSCLIENNYVFEALIYKGKSDSPDCLYFGRDELRFYTVENGEIIFSVNVKTHTYIYDFIDYVIDNRDLIKFGTEEEIRELYKTFIKNNAEAIEEIYIKRNEEEKALIAQLEMNSRKRNELLKHLLKF